MSLQLARLLKQAGQAAPESKPVLEVNPDHPLVKKLDGSHFNDLAQICSTRPCWPRAACPKTRPMSSV
jgi:HSP90 family molecular chaperone